MVKNSNQRMDAITFKFYYMGHEYVVLSQPSFFSFFTPLHFLLFTLGILSNFGEITFYGEFQIKAFCKLEIKPYNLIS